LPECTPILDRAGAFSFHERVKASLLGATTEVQERLRD
jgi:hypothetical protein